MFRGHLFCQNLDAKWHSFCQLFGFHQYPPKLKKRFEKLFKKFPTPLKYKGLHCFQGGIFFVKTCQKLKRPFEVALIFIQADEGGLVCNQRACALYVIATKSRMASRASVYYCRRLDNIHPFGMIPYSPCGLRTYRIRRISSTPYGVIWTRRTRKENAMAKNLLLEYSEELATKCELLC